MTERSFDPTAFTDDESLCELYSYMGTYRAKDSRGSVRYFIARALTDSVPANNSLAASVYGWTAEQHATFMNALQSANVLLEGSGSQLINFAGTRDQVNRVEELTGENFGSLMHPNIQHSVQIRVEGAQYDGYDPHSYLPNSCAAENATRPNVSLALDKMHARATTATNFNWGNNLFIRRGALLIVSTDSDRDGKAIMETANVIKIINNDAEAEPEAPVLCPDLTAMFDTIGATPSTLASLGTHGVPQVTERYRTTAQLVPTDPDVIASLQAAAQRAGIKYAFLLAVRAKESRGNPAAVRFEANKFLGAGVDCLAKTEQCEHDENDRDKHAPPWGNIVESSRARDWSRWDLYSSGVIPYVPGGNPASPSTDYRTPAGKSALDNAWTYDPVAAMMSTSWGWGQVMGYNMSTSSTDPIIAAAAGETVAAANAFYQAFYAEPERYSGQMFAEFMIGRSHLVTKANNLDFTGFATGYNGGGCCGEGSRNYDVALESLYAQIIEQGVDPNI